MREVARSPKAWMTGASHPQGIAGGRIATMTADRIKRNVQTVVLRHIIRPVRIALEFDAIRGNAMAIHDIQDTLAIAGIGQLPGLQQQPPFRQGMQHLGPQANRWRSVCPGC